VKRAVAALVTAALVVIAFVGGRASAPENHTALPIVEEGWAIMPTSMHAIACCGRDKAHAGGRSYLANAPHWRDLRSGDDAWHEGSETPTCFNDRYEPIHVRIGHVETRAAGGIGTDLIAWLECL
jgi:hypothetical protein